MPFAHSPVGGMKTVQFHASVHGVQPVKGGSPGLLPERFLDVGSREFYSSSDTDLGPAEMCLETTAASPEGDHHHDDEDIDRQHHDPSVPARHGERWRLWSTVRSHLELGG